MQNILSEWKYLCVPNKTKIFFMSRRALKVQNKGVRKNEN